MQAAPTQTTVVQVKQESPWWVLLLVFAGPLGCIGLPMLLMLGLAAFYFAPLVLGGIVAALIWQRYPGTREQRSMYAWISVGVGFLLTLLMWVLVLGLSATQPTST